MKKKYFYLTIQILFVLLFLRCNSESGDNSQTSSPQTQSKSQPPVLSEIKFSTEDSLWFKNIVRNSDINYQEYSELVISIGKSLKGTPYKAHTLEQADHSEKLTINCRSFDCVTFVENTIAIANAIHKKDTSFYGFTNIIEKIRYRDGIRKGYESRLHYFTDWLYDNENKGFIKIITADSLFETETRITNFMTKNYDKYQALSDTICREKIRTIEEIISKRPFTYIPKRNVKDAEHLIKDGDIIVITSGIEGLDALHTGLAIHIDGRVHLLHASLNKEVIVSEETLHDYLKKHKLQSGIMIGRAIFN